jgi:succinoglycan biosynthesis protein ExoO
MGAGVLRIMTSMASGQPATAVPGHDAPAGERPVVAVVMPAFNARRTILEAVHSVLGQSWRELELVVCDDGSTDGTAELLVGISDPRLTVLRNPSNLGQGRSRDRAIQSTVAPWIAVIDADDRWAPDRLERLMRANAGEHDTMVFDDLMMCHDTPSGMRPWRRLRGKAAFGSRSDQPRLVPVETFVTAARLLVKPVFPARVVREHAIVHGGRRFGEDIEYFLRLVALGVRLRYVPEPLYLYRITPGSVTASLADERAMGDAIRACAGFPGFTDSAMRALDAKLRALSDNEKLYQLARHVHSGRVLQAAILLARHPRVAVLAPARAMRRLGYELHRVSHAGSRQSALQGTDEP